ncbi:hypothetical protein [Bacillus sp. JCM 19034]|uniref:hypothetical protein n=1 Tax=Bacillus sp. JCM 19034 TaxID=1481928 RepID=UPI000784CC2A|nr:hypothetical protein [Bacillus sp. JCM 19034]
MKAKTVRAFASGLLLAGAVCGITYTVESGGSNKSDQVEEESLDLEIEETELDVIVEHEPSVDEIMDKLLTEGYIVKKEEEWQALLDDMTADHEDELTDLLEQISELEDELENVEDGQVIYRTILTVTSGMTSIDVGQALERANIIDRAMDFFDEVEDQDLSQNLKPGTYEVDSSMSMSKIIKIIFK